MVFHSTIENLFARNLYMFNFLLITFICYHFYKHNIKTGRFKSFLIRSLPNFINVLQSFSDRIEGKNRYKNRFSSHNNNMSMEEARQILGVKANSNREEINSAFKKLMLANHPDKGGSQYIAAKIIQAKETLIK
jgi:hypothetical protein